jgi:hypothetical protein
VSKRETARIRAARVNSGNHTFAEADLKLAASTVSIILCDDAAGTPAGQAAFLTAVTNGARSFGQVFFDGPVEQPLLLSLPGGAKTLRDAGIFFGSRAETPKSTCPQISIGTSPPRLNGWSVQAFWDGWTAGAAPSARPGIVGRSDCLLAGATAGALAVGQAFLLEQGDIRAGRTSQTLSFWHT